MMIHISRVYRLVFCLLVCTVLQTSPTCPNICCYDKPEQDMLDVVCDLSKAKDIRSLILPNNTRSLDLSSSQLTRIPSELFANLTNLKVLSLARNNITTIEENTFSHLIGLDILNLTNNNISNWKGPIYPELPSLRIIDLTGNAYWKPDKRLLNVTALREIRGVTWSQDCVNCWLKWSDASIDESGPPEDMLCNQAMLYELQGFEREKIVTDTCSIERCGANCEENTEVIQQNIKDRSYDRGKYFYAGHAVGGMAVFLNLIVLVNVLLSKAMRRQLSMCLIANLASCDIMIGIYVILISKHNFFLAMVEQTGKNIKVKYCVVSGILLTVGEIVALTTALLLTVDKYTCIVYGMKPDVRLRKKPAYIFLLVAWIGAFLFAISPYYGILNLEYSPVFMCSMPVNSGKTFIIYPLAIITVYYMVMLPLYIHIFVFVRRSSAAMGLHRNAALAKQIFVLVGSNFLLFVVPMILLLINVFVVDAYLEVVLNESIKDHIVYIWLPIMLLGINSMLNPVLYAFRRKKFQREFIDRVCLGGKLSERMRRAFSALKSSRMSSSASKVELYEVEMQSNAQRVEQQRIVQTNSQIPLPEMESAVLNKMIAKTID